MITIAALIRRLGSDNDNEVVATARALARELRKYDADLNVLAVAWERFAPTLTVRPDARPPFDHSKVTAAVTLYAQDKTTVTMNKTIMAVKNQITELNQPHDTHTRDRYILAQLRALGFTPSKSGLTYSR